MASMFNNNNNNNDNDNNSNNNNNRSEAPIARGQSPLARLRLQPVCVRK